MKLVLRKLDTLNKRARNNDVTTEDIATSIQSGHQTAAAIQRHLFAGMRAVDRALQKAKREGRIVFDRFAREWRMSQGK